MKNLIFVHTYLSSINIIPQLKVSDNLEWESWASQVLFNHHKPILKPFLINFNICSLIILSCQGNFETSSLLDCDLSYDRRLYAQDSEEITKSTLKPTFFWWWLLHVAFVGLYCHFEKTNTLRPFTFLMNELWTKQTCIQFNKLFFCWNIVQKYNFHTCMDFIWLVCSIQDVSCHSLLMHWAEIVT